MQQVRFGFAAPDFLPAEGADTTIVARLFMSSDRPARRPPAGFLLYGLRVALTALAFIGFFCGAALLGWIVLRLVHGWPGGVAQRQKRCQRLVRTTWVWFHDYLRWVGLVDFDRVRQAIDVQGPAIVIANHPTLIDITALTVAVGPACIVAKKALFGNPLVGPLLRACGHIAVGPPGDGSELAVDQAEARLRAGHVVILFPEGTRSPVGGLGRFRLGAFELARRTGAPIHPVRITAEPPALWKGLPWYSIPRQTVLFRLEPLPSISIPPSATMAELHEITATTKATLAARLPRAA
jgi:1-acyl-sn-glycerol-3-phosphate acyltransferase